MKFLRNFLETIEPKMAGNKYLHTVYDGFATFLFTPNATTTDGVHIRDGIDLKRTMVTVVMALQVCLLFGMWNIGHQHYTAFGLYPGMAEALFTKLAYGFLQLLPIIIVAHVVGLGVEFFFAAKKGHPIEEGFLVTGMLIPLIVPPAIPLWMLAISVVFAVVIGKEAFGGTGMNILNIALTCRVFLFFAYPTEMSGDNCWVAHDYNYLHQIFGMGASTLSELGQSVLPEKGWRGLLVNGFSGATPLALAAKGGWAAVENQFTIQNLLIGDIPGSVGETCKIAIIIGALILVVTGIGSWQIMLSMILGAAFMGFIINMGGGYLSTEIFGFEEANPFFAVPFYYHLIMGSFLFAMAFMATDPVTAAQTLTGKFLYGFMIGCVGIIVRVLNPAFPEGWMLAILFMNVFAPLIDHWVYSRNIKRRLARAN